MTIIHKLKIDQTPFNAISDGRKKAEVRYNDRAYKVGDLLLLQETAYTTRQMAIDGLPLAYTGREVTKAITHVQTGFGLPSDLCVLSLGDAAVFQDAPC